MREKRGESEQEGGGREQLGHDLGKAAWDASLNAVQAPRLARALSRSKGMLEE